MFLEIQNLVGITEYLKHIDRVFLVNVFAKLLSKKTSLKPVYMY